MRTCTDARGGRQSIRGVPEAREGKRRSTSHYKKEKGRNPENTSSGTTWWGAWGCTSKDATRTHSLCCKQALERATRDTRGASSVHGSCHCPCGRVNDHDDHDDRDDDDDDDGSPIGWDFVDECVPCRDVHFHDNVAVRRCLPPPARPRLSLASLPPSDGVYVWCSVSILLIAKCDDFIHIRWFHP